MHLLLDEPGGDLPELELHVFGVETTEQVEQASDQTGPPGIAGELIGTATLAHRPTDHNRKGISLAVSRHSQVPHAFGQASIDIARPRRARGDRVVEECIDCRRGHGAQEDLIREKAL